MKAILNHKTIDIDNLLLSLTNRGFKYGDGLFETIALINGTPRFLKDHLNRLKKGAEVLKLDLDDQIDYRKICRHINNLQEQNKIQGDAILRLYIWRNAEGKYTPNGRNCDALLTIEDSVFNKLTLISKADFSNTISNYPSCISSLKTMSALNYVIAGIEKKERKLDEIILLDSKGNISEALSSNIFWKKDEKFYTPPLSTGCIEGVMRNWLIKELIKNGYQVKEKLSKIAQFIQADSIFTTNANGINYIQTIDKNSYTVDTISYELLNSVS